MRVMVLGASGLVGGHVLERLLADPAVPQVVAPVRRPLGQAHTKLDSPQVDFERLPADAPWWQVDAAICALGTTRAQAGSREAFARVDHDYPLAAARCLRTHGCPAFVLNSAMGADPGSAIFYNRVKGELERDLRTLGFESLVLVRPGLIGGEREQPRPAEQLGQRVLGALGPVLPRRLRVNPAEAIAAAMVDAALQPVPGVREIESARLTGQDG